MRNRVPRRWCSPSRVTLLAVVASVIAGWAGSPARSQDVATAGLPFQIVTAADSGERRVSAHADGKPLPLAAPKDGRLPSSSGKGKKLPQQPIVTVATSLAVVLGLFGLLVWFTRRQGKKNAGGLPGEVVETLGRLPLNKQQEMHLVRIGNKLLLLAVTATSAETLTEITDAAEIQRLTNLCQQSQPGQLSASFRQVLSQLNREAESQRALATARF